MESLIKLFSISNLFGYKNIQIVFDEPYKILVGENGSGKTTLMNCLFYTLSRKYEMLATIEFDAIRLDFINGKSLDFSKSEVEAYIEKDRQFQTSQIYRILSDKIKGKEYATIKNIVYSSEPEDQKIDKIMRRMRALGFEFHAPSLYVYKNVERLIHEYVGIEFSHKMEMLDKLLTSAVFYFPTYRRVESSIVSWDNISNRLRNKYPFIEKDEITEALNNELIQFGMNDVDSSILKITDEIKRRTVEGFSSIMGSILSQLSKNKESDDRIYSFEEEKVRIILERLGDKIKEETKKNIIKYASSTQLDNKNLNYLIGKLIKLYEDQEEYDTAIKSFMDKCNKYLNNKYFVYDESRVEIYIESEHSKRRLELNCLSSGEKQIVSLFSKIYLDIEHTFIILFDEPELSLSLDWQEQLLPDIVASRKCQFMLAVTHSPFIYNNDLKRYAAGLADFVMQ